MERLEDCRLCGHRFDVELLGVHGCPNCNDDGIDQADRHGYGETHTRSTTMSSPISAVMADRLFAAHSSLVSAEAQLEEIKGEHTDAKKTRDDRESALLEAINAAREKKSGRGISEADSEAIFKLDKDYRRADERFEVCDREKRRAQDMVQKQTARVLGLVAEAKEGPDVFNANAKDKPSTTAFYDVPLEDLVGIQYVRPLLGMKIDTIGAFLTAWGVDQFEKAIKAKTVDKHTVGFAGARIVSYLKDRGEDFEKQIPKGMGELKADIGKLVETSPPPAPKAEEPATPPAPVDVAQGENQHMLASVTELEAYGVKGEICKRLVQAGFEQMGQVLEWAWAGAHPSGIPNLNGGEFDRVAAGARLYAKKHMLAAFEIDKGEPEKPIRNQRHGPRVGRGAGPAKQAGKKLKK